MAKHSSTGQWQREGTRFWLSLIISFVITVLAFRFARVNPWALVLLFVLSNVFILQFMGLRPKELSKVFVTEMAEAQTIVSGVLAEKGLPFGREGGVYYFEDIPLKITLSPYQRGQVGGILIRFVPYSGDNIPLVLSLSERIDDAFTPKGL